MPIPTITSQARCTVFTWRVVGRSSAGKLSRPSMTVLVPSVGSDRNDARPGISMPPLTFPSSLIRPSSVSGTSLLVLSTSSMAANFVGSLL